jgi:hypothetical protein
MLIDIFLGIALDGLLVLEHLNSKVILDKGLT